MRRLALAALALFCAAASCFAQVPGVAPLPAMMAGAIPGTSTTWNPSDVFASGGPTLSNGNLTATGSYGGRATLSKSTGKWYFEVRLVTIGGGGSLGIGIATSSWNDASAIGAGSGSYAIQFSVSGAAAYQPAGTSSGVTYANGDVVNVAADLTNGQLYFGKNGVWNGSMNPAAGTGGVGPNFSGSTFFPAFGLGSSGTTPTVTALFNHPSRAPPSGYSAW